MSIEYTAMGHLSSAANAITRTRTTTDPVDAKAQLAQALDHTIQALHIIGREMGNETPNLAALG